jgi:hypothetical protein
MKAAFCFVPLGIILLLSMLFAGCDDLNAPNRTQVDHWHDDGKPTLCDFMRSPIGGKACHYKSSVTIAIVWKRGDKLWCAENEKGLLPKPQEYTLVMQWSDGSSVQWDDCPITTSTNDIGLNAYVVYNKVEDR